MKQLWGAVWDRTRRMWKSAAAFSRDLWRRTKKFGRMVAVAFAVLVALLLWVFYVGAGWIATDTLESALVSVRDWIQVPWQYVQGIAQDLLDDGAIACPVVAIMAFLRKCVEETGTAWSHLRKSFKNAGQFIEGSTSASKMREEMWNTSFHLALPFVVAGIAGSVVDAAAEKRVDEAKPRASLSMSEVKPDAQSKAQPADVLTVVQAQVHALKEKLEGQSNDQHGVVCGYVGPNEDTVDDLRATAAMHYGFETDNPVSTLTMLVEPGTYWKVGYCVDSDEQDELTKPQIKVRVYSLGVDLENVAGKSTAEAGAPETGAGASGPSARLRGT